MNKVALCKGFLVASIMVMLGATANCQIHDVYTKMDTFDIKRLSFAPNLTIAYHIRPIVPKFNPNTLPFFCKIEHKIETKSKIALRCRLGELNYVNSLENK